MKKLKKVLYVFAGIVVLLWATGNNHLYLGLYDTYLQGRKKPDVLNPDLFPTRDLLSPNPKSIPLKSNYTSEAVPEKIQKVHDEYSSLGFLVIHQDSILFEKYFQDHDRTKSSNSFSMAKTILSIVTGVAVKEGKLNLDDKVGKYLPEYIPAESDLTVRHLLNMTSGMNYDEDYANPIGFMAKAYYGDDLQDLLEGYEQELEAGTQWEYLGGNNLLLSLLLKKAVGEPVGTYAEKHIWKPLQMEQEARWILDHEDGNEKSFSGFYATTRDYAKLGLLFNHLGNYEGKQIVDTVYVINSIQPVNVKGTDGEIVDHYGFAWWLLNYKGLKINYMQGILGQYVICIPEKDLVIVRTGQQRMEKSNNKNPDDLFLWIDEGLRLAQD